MIQPLVGRTNIFESTIQVQIDELESSLVC